MVLIGDTIKGLNKLNKNILKIPRRQGGLSVSLPGRLRKHGRGEI